MTDPYKLLGITSSATDDEVKKAYRQMCRKYHPDKNPGNQAAEEMFKLVNEAYETILEQRKNGYSGGYGFGSSGSYSSSSADDGEQNYYQAAANYINNNRFSEALNVLGQIRNRNAQWYFLSALANSGTGNNYAALDHARKAASMDPGNMYYTQLVNSLSGGGARYRNVQQNYGSNVYYDNNFCLKLCALDMCLNCCDCDVCLCCL